GRIAAAYYDDVLVLVEEAVAGGATRNAAAHESLLGGQAQVLRGGARGDDERVAGVFAAVVALEDEGAARKVDLGDVIKDDFGVESLGMCKEPLHVFRALHAGGV